uniref:Uncharacterized protein n=1 Tax=Anguilla anguilla TaxID=7936 RepID=A0A0E9RSI3_ANGAN
MFCKNNIFFLNYTKKVICLLFHG